MTIEEILDCFEVLDVDESIKVSHIDRIPWMERDSSGHLVKVNSSRLKVFFRGSKLPKKVQVQPTEKNWNL